MLCCALIALLAGQPVALLAVIRAHFSQLSLPASAWLFSRTITASVIAGSVLLLVAAGWTAFVPSSASALPAICSIAGSN